MVMPWAGHIYTTEGALNTERKESKKKEKKMDKSMDVFWVCDKPQLHSSPCNGLFLFLSLFFFFLACLSLPSSETEREYVHKDRNSIVYTDQYRLGSEGEKTKHLLNTNEASRLVC